MDWDFGIIRLGGHFASLDLINMTNAGFEVWWCTGRFCKGTCRGFPEGTMKGSMKALEEERTLLLPRQGPYLNYERGPQK